MSAVTFSTRRLTMEAALTAVRAAVSTAESMGVAVNAAVVDQGGNLLSFLRGDGAFFASGSIAQNKAWTAAGFQMSSGSLYAELSSDPAVLSGVTCQPGVAAFAGGLSIFDGEEMVGAIGVSGATAEQDESCARAGIEAIGLTSE